MTSAQSNIIFDDLFTITAIDMDGKKFDRVSRLVATSSNLGMHLTLDYNIELYSLNVDDKFTLVLASSLARGGATDATEGKDVWRPDGKGQQGLEEDYEYVMYGKIYKFDEGQADNVTAYISYGGLLMSLTGSYRHMQGIIVGDSVYLLMRK
ncbi:DNA-directed RNA polymerases I, II, and III subunit RPABC3 [Ceratobasidium sp. 392]|nr:DNA-directed RNA polymerases I, II, and III subunit RPABC3 [Ceratobasidium sp. 392]